MGLIKWFSDLGRKQTPPLSGLLSEWSDDWAVWAYQQYLVAATRPGRQRRSALKTPGDVLRECKRPRSVVQTERGQFGPRSPCQKERFPMSSLPRNDPILPPMRPAELAAMFADCRIRSDAIRQRHEALQDALDETRFPEVPYDHPAWDNDARWELSPIDSRSPDSTHSRKPSPRPRSAENEKGPDERRLVRPFNLIGFTLTRFYGNYTEWKMDSGSSVPVLRPLCDPPGTYRCVGTPPT